MESVVERPARRRRRRVELHGCWAAAGGVQMALIPIVACNLLLACLLHDYTTTTLLHMNARCERARITFCIFDNTRHTNKQARMQTICRMFCWYPAAVDDDANAIGFLDSTHSQFTTHWLDFGSRLASRVDESDCGCGTDDAQMQTNAIAIRPHTTERTAQTQRISIIGQLESLRSLAERGDKHRCVVVCAADCGRRRQAGGFLE